MLVAICTLSVGSVGCGTAKDTTPARAERPARSTAVDVVMARPGRLAGETEYTGTTVPIRAVSVRSRLEGRLLDLNVDVGDRVSKGQAIARLDDAVLSSTVLQAEAEVAARQAEVAQAIASVRNARAQVERAKIEYQRAQNDAKRFAQLAKAGAVSAQTGENAIAQSKSALQSLRAAEQQVKLQQQTAGAAAQRVLVHKAIRASAQERQSYTTIKAPIDGIVLERVSETGNLLFAGNEVIKLGDFNQVKAIVKFRN